AQSPATRADRTNFGVIVLPSNTLPNEHARPDIPPAVQLTRAWHDTTSALVPLPPDTLNIAPNVARSRCSARAKVHYPQKPGGKLEGRNNSYRSPLFVSIGRKFKWCGGGVPICRVRVTLLSLAQRALSRLLGI